MGSPKPPALPPTPLPPQVMGPGIISPDAQAALNREKIIAQARGGLYSTMAAGKLGAPVPTVAKPSLLGG